jgi:uncharacterized membrane-anchored protein YhcB (DUF1043 family)
MKKDSQDIVLICIGFAVGVFIGWLLSSNYADQQCEVDMDKFDDLLDQFQRDNDNKFSRYFKLEVIKDATVGDLIYSYHQYKMFTEPAVEEMLQYIIVPKKEGI